jgi:Leucine-rich repeat (LRR) protein
MKLVRENINEKFTEDSDPIEDMEIGSKYLIRKWFESVGVNRSRYAIDDVLNIYVEGSLDLRGTNVTKLPDNLRIEGYLDLQRTQITELPENLSVGGFLDLYKTSITKLPDNLSVGGYIDVRETQIKEFPSHLDWEKIIDK